MKLSRGRWLSVYGALICGIIVGMFLLLALVSMH